MRQMPETGCHRGSEHSAAEDAPETVFLQQRVLEGAHENPSRQEKNPDDRAGVAMTDLESRNFLIVKYFLSDRTSILIARLRGRDCSQSRKPLTRLLGAGLGKLLGDHLGHHPRINRVGTVFNPLTE